MKVLMMLILIHLLALGILNAATYDFPIKNPYQATILNAASPYINPYSPGFQDYKKAFYPERAELPFLENRNYANFRFYPQTQPRKHPLVFVLGGLGSTSESGTNVFYAKILHQQGYNVVSVASPFFWRFNLGYMSKATPGYLPTDTLELYEYLKFVMKTLKYKVDDFPKIYLTGYSLGAIESIFIGQRDAEERYFQFEKIVAVNPPVNVFHSGSNLDDMYQDWQRLSETHKAYIEKKVFFIANSLINSGINLEAIHEILKNFPLSPRESKSLIGSNFRKSLGEVIFTSELVNRRGSIQLHTYQSSPQLALSEAYQYGYLDYFKKILFPSIDTKGQLTHSAVYYEMSLLSRVPYLKSSQKLHVFHNQDDIILKEGDIEFLKENLGDKLTLYPYGGHLGNIWFPQNTKDYLAAFTR